MFLQEHHVVIDHHRVTRGTASVGGLPYLHVSWRQSAFTRCRQYELAFTCPYTKRFDELVDEFNKSQDRPLSPHLVWRLVATLAK